jgi:hypothetical protein
LNERVERQERYFLSCGVFETVTMDFSPSNKTSSSHSLKRATQLSDFSDDPVLEPSKRNKSGSKQIPEDNPTLEGTTGDDEDDVHDDRMNTTSSPVSTVAPRCGNIRFYIKERTRSAIGVDLAIADTDHHFQPVLTRITGKDVPAVDVRLLGTFDTEAGAYKKLLGECFTENSLAANLKDSWNEEDRESRNEYAAGCDNPIDPTDAEIAKYFVDLCHGGFLVRTQNQPTTGFVKALELWCNNLPNWDSERESYHLDIKLTSIKESEIAAACSSSAATVSDTPAKDNDTDDLSRSSSPKALHVFVPVMAHMMRAVNTEEIDMEIRVLGTFASEAVAYRALLETALNELGMTESVQCGWGMEQLEAKASGAMADKDIFQDATNPTSAEIIGYLVELYHSRYMRRRQDREEPLEAVVKDLERWCFNEDNWAIDREKYVLEIRECWLDCSTDKAEGVILM